jgi:hypothetical protein
VPVPDTLPAGPRPFRLHFAFRYTGGEYAPAEVKVRWGISADGSAAATCSGSGAAITIGPAAAGDLISVGQRVAPACGGPGSHLAFVIERTGTVGTLHLVAASVTFE